MNVQRSLMRAAEKAACLGRRQTVRAAQALGLEPYFRRITWSRGAWALVIGLIGIHAIQIERLAPPREGLRSDLDCLALNIYHEARGELLEGMRAVGHVVMNRVTDKSFPSSVCQVVRDGGEDRLHDCQFSWWCDGRSDRPIDGSAWLDSRAVAWDVLRGVSKDPTGGALWYHADYVAPDWRQEMTEVTKIGQHIFYQRPD